MSNVLVTVKSASFSENASPTSRMSIPQEQYDEAVAAAEKAGRPCKYTLEEDQAGCQGMVGEELAAAQAARKPIREKKEALLAEAAAL